MKLFDIPEYKTETSSSFVDNMQLPVHRWFRFSAGFSAEWVKSVIKRKQDPSVRVLDPFAGSGTTLIASDECDVDSVGIDAHSFVARIAKAKLKWDSDLIAFEERVSDIVSAAKVFLAEPGSEPSDIPELLRKSYSGEAIRELFALRKAWEQYADDSAASELAWLALTAILRSCSHVGTAPWQYVLPKKRKAKVLDPFDALKFHHEMMLEDMILFQETFTKTKATMIRGDARTLNGVETNSIDLVITSPPYTNNYDYADATRLELTFWGIVDRWSDLQDAVRKYLIRSCSQHASAEKLVLSELLDDPNLEPIIDELAPVCRELSDERHLHGGKKKYHLMVAAYFSDMARVWKALRRVCKAEAEVCYVIGDSAPYGIHVPVDKWLAQLANAAGFGSMRFVKTRDRNVKWDNRIHTVPLKEGQLWLKVSDEEQEEISYMDNIASPGHKLGQMIGNFFEDFFDDSLSEIAAKHGVYCDRRGLRPAVRGHRRKVTWTDSAGNPHDLDYVFERNGSYEKRGEPAAFIELAWRRYTKHSRNKAGEIEGALIHLGDTFPGVFLGAILGGEFTEGSLDQLESHDINVLYIPFDRLAEAFNTKGVGLRYAESASDENKMAIIRQWEQLSKSELEDIKREFARLIDGQYQKFLTNLEGSLTKQVERIRVYYLYGEEAIFDSIDEAVQALENYEASIGEELEFVKFEIQIRFSNGDRVEGTFQDNKDAIQFLRYFGS